MVPRTVLQIGKEVITLRKRCCSFFTAQAQSDELFQEKNEGHLHFISVFEEVTRILESCPPPTVSAQNKKKGDKGRARFNDDVVNSFEALELEETNLGFEEASTIPRTLDSKTSTVASAHAKMYEADYFRMHQRC